MTRTSVIRAIPMPNAEGGRLAAADQNSDAVVVGLTAKLVAVVGLTTKLVADQGNGEVQLPGVRGLELPGLKPDDVIPQLLGVEEQEVDAKAIRADLEVDLPFNEGESEP